MIAHAFRLAAWHLRLRGIADVNDDLGRPVMARITYFGETNKNGSRAVTAAGSPIGRRSSDASKHA